MSLKPFIVKDKKSNAVRIIKAETRGQVSKYLALNFEIEMASALDVMDVMANGNVEVEDASLVSVETTSTSSSASTEAPAAAAAGTTAPSEASASTARTDEALAA